MSDVDFATWNHRNDAGRLFADGEAEVADTWPQYAEAITAYRRHFDRTLTGTVPGTSAVVAELAQAGVRLLGLTNWSDETFPVAQRRFGILRRLEAIVVSGRERMAKPDPRLYRLLLDRYQVDVGRPVFVDDNAANCAAARDLGLTAIAVRRRRDAAGRGWSRLGMLAERREITEPTLHIAERVLVGGGADDRQLPLVQSLHQLRGRGLRAPGLPIGRCPASSIATSAASSPRSWCCSSWTRSAPGRSSRRDRPSRSRTCSRR